MWGEGKVLVPSRPGWAVEGGWPGFGAAVLTGAGGAGVTVMLLSEVCDCGLPNDGIKDPAAPFVSLNMNKEPGDAPGTSSAGTCSHSLGRGGFFQGCILVCHRCTAQIGPRFRLWGVDKTSDSLCHPLSPIPHHLRCTCRPPLHPLPSPSRRDLAPASSSAFHQCQNADAGELVTRQLPYISYVASS